MMVRCIIGPDPQSENIRTGRKAVDVTGKFTVLNLSLADGKAGVERRHGGSGGSGSSRSSGSGKCNPSGTRISSTLRQDWLALPQVLLHWNQEGWQHLGFLHRCETWRHVRIKKECLCAFWLFRHAAGPDATPDCGRSPFFSNARAASLLKVLRMIWQRSNYQSLEGSWWLNASPVIKK